ncbi:AraC family transcriptional regulator [uncultured Caulobacter sp.]|uniref:AraC family transcriptional regulator n=1 Tax=uncultured Caulobacter sp. TaxID=158749 RepID=UPI00262277B0|nr:AraC family transcriptional regulator [uncultured Caulobacter sp.]
MPKVGRSRRNRGGASLPGTPNKLIESPPPAEEARAADVLSGVLQAVRLSGSLQFCFAPTGVWRTDASPSLASLAGPEDATPFHIVVQGRCWLKIEDRVVDLDEGDVVVFPFGTGHQLGVGQDGPLVAPINDLPPRPWREVPVLRYGDGEGPVRLLCGYLKFAAARFRPLRDALPTMLHVRTRGDGPSWLGAAIAQIVAEVDQPRPGGLSVLERLTEIIFIEVLRRRVAATPAEARGWLAATANPALARCLALIHAEPSRDWSLGELAAAAGLSRSAMSERFDSVLGTSPMRYIRDWRLCLAGVALGASDRAVATIASEAGYASEAAFNRAFTRAQGVPPAAWRKLARQSGASAREE